MGRFCASGMTSTSPYWSDMMLKRIRRLAMAHDIDWLSRFLATVSVTGRLEIHCLYGAPWNITYIDSPPGEMPYHLVIRGTAVLEPPPGGKPTTLTAGDDALRHIEGGFAVVDAHAGDVAERRDGADHHGGNARG